VDFTNPPNMHLNNLRDNESGNEAEGAEGFEGMAKEDLELPAEGKICKVVTLRAHRLRSLSLIF